MSEHEAKLAQMNASHEQLNRRFLELTEMRHVLRETAFFFDQVIFYYLLLLMVSNVFISGVIRKRARKHHKSDMAAWILKRKATSMPNRAH